MQHADDRHVRAQAGATDLHKVRLCSILQVMLHAVLQVAQVVWLHLRQTHARSGIALTESNILSATSLQLTPNPAQPM